MKYPQEGKTLSRDERCSLLDAVLDALEELRQEEIEELVTPALIDKLETAEGILR